MTDTSVMQDRIGQLCGQFKLPTMGAQSVARFTAAGHGDALATFLEVLEQEAEDRRHRRINRLRRESRLPSGKTWETFEHDRVPLALRQQLDQLAQGSFVERGINVLASWANVSSALLPCASCLAGLEFQVEGLDVGHGAAGVPHCRVPHLVGNRIPFGM